MTRTIVYRCDDCNEVMTEPNVVLSVSEVVQKGEQEGVKGSLLIHIMSASVEGDAHYCGHACFGRALSKRIISLQQDK